MRMPGMFAVLHAQSQNFVDRVRHQGPCPFCRLLCGQLPFGENAENEREAGMITHIYIYNYQG